MFVNEMFHCGDCGQPAKCADAASLVARGWTLTRPHDGYGNPVQWWRCKRCTPARTK
jgi:hypothetical protein